MSSTDQTPRTVNWLGYLALTLLLVLPVSVLTVRSGAWQQGLLMYAIACAGAALLLLTALVMLVLPALRSARGGILKRALLVVPGTLLLLGLLANRGDIPPIHDITTNTIDPPVFVAAVAARGTTSNPLDIKPDTIAQQKLAYPDLSPVIADLTAADAFAKSVATAKTLGWDIIAEDPQAGTVEAVDTTAIMGFKDDIVIRIRREGDSSIIDLRSVSRVGVSDLGANAKRIRAFKAQFGQ
jgi:uncharacterized protein (DUF1499 family)